MRFGRWLISKLLLLRQTLVNDWVVVSSFLFNLVKLDFVFALVNK